jgi:small conductance mechanosensitive channel
MEVAGVTINEKTVQEGIDLVTKHGMNLIGGIVILIAGWMFAKWASAVTRRMLAKSDKVDAMVRGFIANIVKYVIMAAVLIAVLNQFGVETTSLIAVLGAAGLAIGLALQGTLSNVAAGVMLLIFRPFTIGQYVQVAGQGGTVKEVSLFTTELATPDNVQVIIPNASVWGSAVVNYSHHDTRRIDFILSISYGDNIDQALAAAKQVVDIESRVLPDPAPLYVVSELADSSVNVIARIWVKSADYWDVKFALTKSFKENLEANGISIPFPQRDVHLINQAAE